jgi:hypothetical protein
MGRVWQHHRFMEDVRARRLTVNALPTPVATYWRLCRFVARGWQVAPAEQRAILDQAINRPEAAGWLSGDVPAKGMPAWAVAAWRALRQTPQQHCLPDVMRRATLDEPWAAELEGLARLLGVLADAPADDEDGEPLTPLAAVREQRARGVAEKTADLRAYILRSLEEWA